MGFSIILPWQLDYQKAVGDVLEKLEWGLLSPVAWLIKAWIRKIKAKRAASRVNNVAEDPIVNASTEGIVEELK